MQVPVGSLLHKIWQFTFFDEKPIRTTKRRFWLRVVLLPVPAAIVLILFIVLWAVLTLAGNLMTIFSGTGIFVTWSNGSVYVEEFCDFPILEEYQVPSQLVAALLWVCVGLSLLGYYYPNGFMTYGLMTAKIAFISIVIVAVSFLAIVYADKAEDNDLDRIRDIARDAIAKKEEVPDEIVLFVHPPEL